MFVGTGYGSGGYVLAYSYDGVTWTGSVLQSGSIFTTQGCGVAWNGSRWVAVGQGTNCIAYSTDGINWTASVNGNSIFAEVYCTSIAWNGAVWIAGGRLGYGNLNTVAYSYDGANWITSTSGNAIMTGATGMTGYGLWSVASRRPLPYIGINQWNTNKGPTGAFVASQYGTGTTSAGGSLLVTFPNAYSSVPIVSLSVTSGTSAFISANSVSATSLIAYTFNTSGATGTTFSWIASV
jgi:hypothetical protein